MSDPSRVQPPLPTILPVIMAGGGGTRFWPRSRRARPKQFLNLVGERTLIQQAVDRLGGLATADHQWVITSLAQAPLVREQLPELNPNQIVAEPMGRDTAACIAVGAALLERTQPDGVMVCMPADHIIEPAASFQRAVSAAAQLAIEYPEALLTFAVPPTYPATGYGYLQFGAAIPGRNGIEAYRLKAFREKPDAATAERYLQSGEFAWNSGIFVWKVSAILAELDRLQPALLAAVRRIAAAWNTPAQAEVFEREYAGLKRISIDYAIMEHCREGLLLRAPFTWDDVGSWEALRRHYPEDADGHLIMNTQAKTEQAQRCLLAGDGPHQLIAVCGLDDVLVVRDGDITLVAKRGDEGALKKLVESLQAPGLERYL